MSVWDWLFSPASAASRFGALPAGPNAIALHAGADAVIGLALLALAAGLVVFFTNRFRLRRIGYTFAALMTLSALTHFVAIYTLGSPQFGIEQLIRIATAVLAAATAIVFWILLPKSLAAPSAGHLAGLNTQLAAMVEARTAELLAANEGLRQSIGENAIAIQKLARSEAQYRVSFEGAMVGKVQSDPNTGLILRANPAFAAMLGYAPDELVGQIGWELGLPEDRAEDQIAFARVTSGELSAYIREKQFRRRDGTTVWARVSANIVRFPESGQPDIAVAVVENIDERRKAEADLELTRRELEDAVIERTQALAQRDLLLREVYHRVKNNLQVVDSILVMQSRRLSDPEAKSGLASLRSRIYALGLVHHQLMGSSNLQTFDVAPFLKELSDNILDGGGSSLISVTVVAEPLDVGLDFAIPLGLLVTELVTNSLKHAFPNGEGHINVSLLRNDDGTLDLAVADNGTGYDCRADAPGDSAAGLGHKIIAALVGQLKATMTIQSDHGDPHPGSHGDGRMNDLKRHVLVVDDDHLIVMGLTEQVEDMGLAVCGSASTADLAVEMARLHRPTLILMDMRLDGAKDGVDAALAIYETIGSKVIFITGSQEPSTLLRINQDHPSAILFKPVSDAQLRKAIEAAIGPELAPPR